MYEKTYQLKTRPFSSAPNILQYHPTDSAESALRNCRSAIDRQAGPVVIFGGAGTGKTLLLDLLADAYAGTFQVVTIACGRTDTRKDLLQNILFQIGQTYRDLSESELRLELSDYLRPGPHCPNGLLCLVDDAHCLQEDLMDELRVISGIIRGGQLRCQLVMTGNQRLEELLCSPRQESLNQKLSNRSYLQCLSQTETAEYVRAHLRRAGGGNREFFNEESLRQIAKLTQGVPRLINQLCDLALQRCARQGAACVTPAICTECWAELQRLPFGEQEVGSAFSTGKATANPTVAERDGIEFGILDDDSERQPGDAEMVWRSFGRLNRAVQEEMNLAAPAAPISGEPIPLGDSGSDNPLREMGRARQEDDSCEGRQVGLGMGAKRKELAKDESPTERLKAFAGAGGQRTTTDRSAIVHVECDVDPDRPEACEPQSAPTRVTPPSVNPFEEFFETEEVVTEAFVRGTISHNQGASQLTRAILDEFQVDDLRAELLAQRVPSAQHHGKIHEKHRNEVIAEIASDQATVPFPGGLEKAGYSSGATAAESVIEIMPLAGNPRIDDRDMLVISRLNQVSPPPAKPEMPEEEFQVSTGRAYRMDYKQLFTRLRNSMVPGVSETTRQG